MYLATLTEVIAELRSERCRMVLLPAEHAKKIIAESEGLLIGGPWLGEAIYGDWFDLRLSGWAMNQEAMRKRALEAIATLEVMSPWATITLGHGDDEVVAQSEGRLIQVSPTRVALAPHPVAGRTAEEVRLDPGAGDQLKDGGGTRVVALTIFGFVLYRRDDGGVLSKSIYSCPIPQWSAPSAWTNPVYIPFGS